MMIIAILILQIAILIGLYLINRKIDEITIPNFQCKYERPEIQFFECNYTPRFVKTVVSNETVKQVEVVIRDRETNALLSRRHPDDPEVKAARQDESLIVEE